MPARATPDGMGAGRRIAITLAAACALGLAGPASARVLQIQVDRLATPVPAGRVVVTGRVGCEPGEVVGIRVRLSQRATAAWGEGVFRAPCRSPAQEWSVQVIRRRTAGRFEAGGATACTLEVTARGTTPTDAHQACRSVRIV